MQELVPESAVWRACLGISLTAVVLLAWWLRSRRSAAIGAAAGMLLLAWPLWELFQLLDREWDVTTFRGMAAPYAAFAGAGIGVGIVVRRLGAQRHSGGAAMEEPGLTADHGAEAV